MSKKSRSNTSLLRHNQQHRNNKCSLCRTKRRWLLLLFARLRRQTCRSLNGKCPSTFAPVDGTHWTIPSSLGTRCLAARPALCWHDGANRCWCSCPSRRCLAEGTVVKSSTSGCFCKSTNWKHGPALEERATLASNPTSFVHLRMNARRRGALDQTKTTAKERSVHSHCAAHHALHCDTQLNPVGCESSETSPSSTTRQTR